MTDVPIRAGGDPATDSSSSDGQRLLEQSAAARARGDHWRAQQLASAAHQWERAEAVRLRHLAQAQEAWVRMTRAIEQAWDRDVAAATLDELCARNPSLKRAIASRDAAAERIGALGGTPPRPATTRAGHEPPAPR